MRILCKLSAAGLVLTAMGCEAELKDTIISGLLDFLGGSVTDTLTAVLPISDWAAGLLGG